MITGQEEARALRNACASSRGNARSAAAPIILLLWQISCWVFVSRAGPISLVSEPMISGDYLDIAMRGDTLFCSNRYGIMIYKFDQQNIDEPPFEIAHFPTPGQAQGIKLVDSLLFVADGSNGLRIYDLNDFGRITEIGSCEDVKGACGVNVRDTLAFVLGFRVGLYVVSIADLSRPEVIGLWEGHTEGLKIALRDSIAFITSLYLNPNLTAIDISDPYLPSEVTHFSDKATGEFSLIGDDAFLCSDSLYSVSIADLANIHILSSLYDNDLSGDAYYREGYVYSFSYSFGIADARTPASLRFLGGTYAAKPEFPYPRALEVSGDYVFGAGRDRGLYLFDASDKKHPSVIYPVDYKGGHPIDIVRGGNYLFVADASGTPFIQDNVYRNDISQFRVFSIKDIHHPKGVARIDSLLGFGGTFQSILLNDTLVFVSGEECPLYFFSIYNPRSPKMFHKDEMGGSMGMALYGSDMMVASKNYIGVWDIADPNNAAFVAGLNIPTESGTWILNPEIKIQNHYLYVPGVIDNSTLALLTFDLSDLQNITLAGSCGVTVGSGSGSIDLYDHYAYIVDDHLGPGLSVIDISSPAQPEEVFYSDQDVASCMRVKVFGDYLFVADGWAGIKVFNLENPAEPELVGQYDTPGIAMGLDVDLEKGYLFIADWDDVSIYDIAPLLGIWDLQAAEDSHDFGAVTVDSVSSWQLTISNNAILPALIDTISIDNPTFSVELVDTLTLGAGAETTLTVTFSPDSSVAYSGNLTVHTERRDLIVTLMGKGEPLSAGKDRHLPLKFALYPASPNPFNSTVTIRFALPQGNRTRLTVYDIQGREAATVFNGELKAGYHSVVWNAAGEPSGVYFVRLATPKFVRTQKVVAIR